MPPAPGVAPVLSARQGQSTGIFFEWPSNRRGFVLETLRVAGTPSHWLIATNNIGLTDSNFLITIPPDRDARYFRLREGFVPGLQVEAPHYGYDTSAPAMTDGLRSSMRAGANWWALGQPRNDPETGAPLPYAYVDGHAEQVGKDLTPEKAALRWAAILSGNGDSWTKRPGESVGRPGIILLDEVTPAFKDDGQGPAFLEALTTFVQKHGGTRDDLFAFAVRSVAMTPSNHLYGAIVQSANNYLRFFGLELYTSQQAYVTGYEPDQPRVHRGIGDEYLVRRLLSPIRRWTQAGIAPERLMVILTVSNFAGSSRATDKPFYKYLNRQFWMMANGWYTTDRSVSDNNIRTVLRNGVGTYKFGPGTNLWQLNPAEMNRDAYFEKYVHWYCVEGRTNAHPDGVDAGS
jgi:hypothetical protein